MREIEFETEVDSKKVIATVEVDKIDGDNHWTVLELVPNIELTSEQEAEIGEEGVQKITDRDEGFKSVKENQI